MVIATLDTRHFTFQALGVDRIEAEAAMVAGWMRHTAQYRGADPNYMVDALRFGDVNFTEIEPGGFIRDGEPL